MQVVKDTEEMEKDKTSALHRELTPSGKINI